MWFDDELSTDAIFKSVRRLSKPLMSVRVLDCFYRLVIIDSFIHK